MILATIATTIKMYDGVSSTMSGIQSSLKKTITSFENIKIASDGSIEVNKITKAAERYDVLNSKVEKNSNSFIEAKNKVSEFGEKVKNSINDLFGLKDALKNLVGEIDFQEVMDKTDEFANQQYQIEMIIGNVEASAVRQSIENSANSARVNFDSMFDTWADMSKLDVMGGNYQKALAFSELMTKVFKTIPNADVSSMMDTLTGYLEKAKVELMDIRTLFGTDIFNKIDFGDLFEGKENANTGDFINTMLQNKSIIEKEFSGLPILFSEIKQSLANVFSGAFAPLFQQLSQVVSTDRFSAIINGVAKALNIFMSIGGVVIDFIFMIVDAIFNIGLAFSETSEVAIPIIFGLIGALIVYNATMGIAWLLTLKKIAANAIFAVSEFFMALATKAHMIAQLGLNAAIASCPITWIIMAIIVLIAIIFAVIASIIKWQTQAQSSIGVIVGMFHWMLAMIKNILITLFNFVIGTFEILVNMLLTFAKFWANFLNNPTKAIIELIFGMANFIIDQVKLVAQAIDDLFGTNFTAGIQVFQDKLKPLKDKLVEELSLSTGLLKEVDVPDVDFSKFKIERVNMADAYQEGYLKGATWEANRDNLDPASLLETPGTGGAVEQIANNTGRGADAAEDQKDSMEQSVEELKYLRDLAEQEAINRFTTAEIKVEMNNNNNINNDADIDGIVSALSEQVEQAMTASANGVYA